MALDFPRYKDQRTSPRGEGFAGGVPLILNFTGWYLSLPFHRNHAAGRRGNRRPSDSGEALPLVLDVAVLLRSTPRTPSQKSSTVVLDLRQSVSRTKNEEEGREKPSRQNGKAKGSASKQSKAKGSKGVSLLILQRGQPVNFRICCSSTHCPSLLHRETTTP